MHIFLTGEVQVGKSTAINKALALLNIPYLGFKTYGAEYKDDGSSILYISPANNLNIKTKIAERNKNSSKKMVVNKNAFEVTGVEILKNSLNSETKLIIMDEIGFMESNFDGFKNQIREALDSDKIILGVVRNKNTEFLNEVRSHKKVELIEGDVRAYKRTDYSIASRFGNYYRTPSVKFAHLLDANGNDIESTEISAKEILLNNIQSTYDAKGNLLTQTATDADGEIIWTSETTYKNGLKTDVSEYNAKKELKSKTIYTYSFNRLVDESSYDGNGALVWKIIYTYDGNDRIDTVSNYFPSGALSEQSVYDYDENGKIKSITHTDSINLKPLQEVFRYNGDVLTEVTTYDDGKQITKRILIKYNKEGNVSQISTYNVAQKFGGIVSELVAMSDYSYKFDGDPALSDEEEVTIVSEK